MKKYTKGNHNNNLYQHYQQPIMTLSSSKFQQQYQQQQQHQHLHQYCYKYCRYILYILSVILLLLGYYTYLSSLYLVDLTLEGDTLREPNANEQTTIRVSLSSSSSSTIPSLSSSLPEIISLKKFVSHYSLCPCVKEIQVPLLLLSLLLSLLLLLLYSNTDHYYQ